MPRCSGRRGGWLLPLWGVPGGDEADGGDAAGVVPMIATRLPATSSRWTHGPGVSRRNRPADPAPRPGLTHAVVRRPGAARRPRPGPPGLRPHQRDQRARPVRVLQPRQTSGWLALPDPTRTTTSRWRPPPLPATPTDPEPPQPGQRHLHWPRQARPRVRRPAPVRRLSDAGVGRRG